MKLRSNFLQICNSANVDTWKLKLCIKVLISNKNLYEEGFLHCFIVEFFFFFFAKTNNYRIRMEIIIVICMMWHIIINFFEYFYLRDRKIGFWWNKNEMNDLLHEKKLYLHRCHKNKLLISKNINFFFFQSHKRWNYLTEKRFLLSKLNQKNKFFKDKFIF